MTDRLEQETVIVINRGDLDEGFFSVETTNPGHASILSRRIGKKNPPLITKDRLGKITHWSWRVPADRLQKATFGIKGRSPRPKPSPTPVPSP